MGLFIDATGLDRATRRIDRKVDLGRLVRGLTTGIKLEFARYYCLIPYEDDARQFAFLDAVERAGIEVITKRLPPKGVKRQVSMDVHMASDMVTYSLGNVHRIGSHKEEPVLKQENAPNHSSSISTQATSQPLFAPEELSPAPDVKRIVTLVCPSRELSYAINTCHLLSAETVLADFGLYGASDGWRGVDRWIDLSTSETIWRD